MAKKSRTQLGLNLGAKSTIELASIGINTLGSLRKEGWESVFYRLIEKYPERLNLNMASALIGAEIGIDWRKIPARKKEQAKDLIKSLKPKKQQKIATSSSNSSFVEFIVKDQLLEFNVRSRRMFGGYGLYHNEKFFGLIHDGRLYFRTDDKSRLPFMAAGMTAFQPNPRQTLKAYFEVPIEVLEDREELMLWAKQAFLTN